MSTQNGTLHNSKGFTLLEVLAALTVLSLLYAVTATNVNPSKYAADTISGELMVSFADIGQSLQNYQNEKSVFPTGLNDVTFVSYYIYPPVAPNGFDRSYGVSGYNLALQTGQVSPNNGWYVCVKTTVSNANDVKFLALKKTAANLSASRFFYNTSCPAYSNMSDPAASATVYATNWISNQ